MPAVTGRRQQIRAYLVIFSLVCGASFLTCASNADARARIEPDAAARIEHYSKRIAEHPRVYATYLGLAQAYLDVARETHDPEWIKKAIDASENSLAITPSLEGFKMQARIAAFRHRFDEAIQWAERAADLLTVDITDGGVTAIKVEALMGLNRFDEARALLPADGAPLPDFHTAAALGHWLASQKRCDKAATAFVTAAKFALDQNASALAGWAETMAAGVYLDAGQIEPARLHLARAAAFNPGSRFTRIHFAELAVAEGRDEEAITQYESLLADGEDPELHRRIYLLAGKSGDDMRAQLHFEAAEQSLIGILSAGEIYTFDELVRLYADTGLTADEAHARVNSLIKDSK